MAYMRGKAKRDTVKSFDMLGSHVPYCTFVWGCQVRGVMHQIVEQGYEALAAHGKNPGPWHPPSLFQGSEWH
jgi:hypothetical protein